MHIVKLRTRILYIAAIIFLLVISLTRFPKQAESLIDWQLVDSPWPTHGHDFQRTSRSPFVGIEDGIHIEWEKSFGHVNSQSLTVGADGLIYAKSASTYGFTPQGELLKQGFPGGGCYSTPTHLSNNRIYYARTFSWIGINNDGESFWEYSLPYGCFSHTPAITQGGIGYYMLNIPLSSKYIYAFDLAKNELVWTFGMAGWTSLALGHDDTLYVTGAYGSLDAVNPNGSLKWRLLEFFDTGLLYRTDVMTIGDDGNIYTATFKDANLDGSADDNKSSIRALDENGNWLWDFTLDSGLWSCGFALSDEGILYVTTKSMDWVTEKVKLYALSSNGEFLWSYDILANQACGGPVTDNKGNVFVCDKNGYCYGIDGEGKFLWDIYVKNESQVFPLIYADKEMFVATDEGVAALAEGDPEQFFIFLPSLLNQ